MPSIEGGGVEKNFFIITNYLLTKTNNISVITSSKKYKVYFKKKVNIISSNSSIVELLGRRSKFIICLFYLLKEILSSKNSTVLCFQGIVYCTILCRIFSSRVIIRSNSSPSGWSKNSLKKFLYKKIYNMADTIIVNSLAFKEELSKKFNLKSVCIYNPLDKKIILKKSKKKIKFNFFKKNTYNIISMARFAEQKDHECLIKSINNLKNKKNIRLLLLGNGPKKDQIVNMIDKFKLNKYIKIVNFKKNPYPYLKKSKLFILSSNFEGLPNVLLEAIALNKFVISSDCPTGPKEILDSGKGGILFKIGDYKFLSKQIELFFNNESNFKNKKDFAKKRLNRFDYKKRLNDYFNIINLKR